MSSEKKTIPHNLTAGAIALLQEILPSAQWYKEDPEQALVIVDAVGVHEGLPDLGPKPKQVLQTDSQEAKDAFEAKWKLFAERDFTVEWTQSEREAVQKCVRFYLKGGMLGVTKHVRVLIKELELTRAR